MTPKELKMVESNKHIPLEEILQDIRDTQREIEEREAFIRKLRYLIRLRDKV